MDNALVALRDSYRRRLGRPSGGSTPANLMQLASGYQERRERKILELVRRALDLDGLAVAASAAGIADAPLADHLTGRAAEAWRLQFPHESFADIARQGPGAVAAHFDGLKGKYFELLVRDQLNAHQWIGDIHLSGSEHAVLASAQNQPAWDVQIRDAHGHVVQYLQVKASDQLSYIKHAIDAHPDIEVIAPSDVHHLAGLLVDPTSLDHINTSVQSFVEHGLAWGHVLEHAAVGLPFAMILYGEGKAVLTARRTFVEAAGEAKLRAAKSGSAVAASHLVWLVCPHLWVAVPTAIGTRVLTGSVMERSRLFGAAAEHGRAWRARGDELLALMAAQPMLELR